MATVAPDMCRVTIVTPSRWADLALPADEPLAEMLPALLDHVADPELDVDAVVLQRLGRPPLDEARSLAANGVVDGETLYLNPESTPMPEADFDDLVDGIATAMSTLDHRWAERHTRRALLGIALVPVMLALAGLVLRPAEQWLTAIGSVLLCGLLLAGAAAASRAWDDLTLAVMAGALSVCFGAVAAVFGVLSVSPAPVDWAAPALAGFTAAFSAASAVDVAIGGVAVGFAGTAFACGLGALAALVSLLSGWSAQQSLALALVLGVVVGEVMVTSAARLAGVVLPPLPRSAPDLEESTGGVPGHDLLTKALRVDRYLTALLWGSTAVIGGSAALLVRYGGWSAVLVYAAAVASLLRLRVMPGRGQRAAVLVAGLAGPTSHALQAVLGSEGPARVSAPVVCLAAAGVLVLLARIVPGRRFVPHLGRAAELLEGLVSASLLPLLLGVLGTYAAARNLR